MWQLVGLLFLGGCDAYLTGQVIDPSGAPVHGAVLSGGSCDAVSGTDGRFEVQCARGTWEWSVQHPAYISRTVPISAEGAGSQDVGTITIEPIPVEAGLFLHQDGRFLPLSAAPVKRTQTAERQRWCLEGGDAVTAKGPEVKLLDNHAVDWRLFRADKDGCVYQLDRSTGEYWTWKADIVTPTATEVRAEGRNMVTFTLEPGTYAFLEWYDGFLVPGEADMWRGWWLAVP